VADAGAKGSLFIHSHKFIVEREGTDVWRALLAALGEPDRELIEGLLDSGIWYSIGTWNRMLRTLVAQRGPLAAYSLARFIAEEDLNFVFRMLLKVGSPEFVLKRSPWIYKRYFDVGDVTVAEEGPRQWKLTLAAPLAEEEGPCQVVCQYGVTGWVVEALLRTGARDAKVTQAACRFDGAERCEFSAIW
jgi:hypothetical protein